MSAKLLEFFVKIRLTKWLAMEHIEAVVGRDFGVGRIRVQGSFYRWFVFGLLLFPAAYASAAAPICEPTINARSAILIDNQTDAVLWEHQSDLPLPPASTTKIVTALLALQSGQLDDSFYVFDVAGDLEIEGDA